MTDKRFSAKNSSDTKTGYTLIELLVVMVIVATLAGLAIPSLFRDSELSVEEELQRVKRIVEKISVNAVLEQTNYALSFNEEGLTEFYWSYADENWLPRKHGIYAYRNPGEFRLVVDIAESKPERFAEDDFVADNQVLFFYTSGENNAFSFEVKDEFSQFPVGFFSEGDGIFLRKYSELDELK